MHQKPSKTCSFQICLLVVVATAFFVQAPPALAAKTLASKALAAAIENNTLDQVKQEVMMDAAQKQRFDIDESGIEALGRDLLSQGNTKQAVEILQLNQGIHHNSPRAAVALGDAYQTSGDDIQARVYYDMALNLDPDNEQAKQGVAKTGSSQEVAMGAMGGAEFDPASIQDAMAQMGMEMTPEQQKKMQEAMALMEQYQETGEMPQASSPPKQPAPRRSSQSATEPTHESEFCEVLHRFNSHKRISDPQIRARVEGHYQEPDHANWAWNVESTCGDFLIAVPLWADVSPPVLELEGDNRFEDANGATWEFEMGGDGKPTSVVRTDAEGTTTKMMRLGDPKKY